VGRGLRRRHRARGRAGRIADLARERRAEQAAASASRRRDLDETRRLAYMALASTDTSRYERVASIVNALAHQGAEINRDEALRRVTAVVEGVPRDAEVVKIWLFAQIDRMSNELGS
jgi:hypothetical protein